MFPFKRVLNFLSSNLVAIMLFLLTGIPLGASKSGGDDKEGEKVIATAAKYAGYYLHKLGLLNYYHSNALQNEEET